MRFFKGSVSYIFRLCCTFGVKHYQLQFDKGDLTPSAGEQSSLCQAKVSHIATTAYPSLCRTKQLAVFLFSIGELFSVKLSTCELSHWVLFCHSNRTCSFFKWAQELADYERTFLDQAAQVNSWDRLLMENGEKVQMFKCSSMCKCPDFLSFFFYLMH